MKCDRAPLQNETECVDMTLVHIKEGVSGELCRLMRPGTPFIEGSIELIFQVSTKVQVALGFETHRCRN
jgi:hypothetical protein